jgi:hypothetical protein
MRIRGRHEEVVMPTTAHPVPGIAGPDVSSASRGLTLDQVLLSCGVVYALGYAAVNDLLAASRYEGYSRMSQAVSELSATGAPTRSLLVAFAPVWVLLMVAFGVGVWRSAGAKRSLRVTGAVLVAFGVMGLFWLPFPMTSRDAMASGVAPANDVGHLVLAALTVVLIIAQLAASAVAFGWWFRLYALATALVVLGFGSLTARESAKLPDGDPTPWMGLYERINIGAWLLWMVVLAVALLRSGPATRKAAVGKVVAGPIDE